ncbi:hypothetical protein BC936DRAFT_142310, partial [Jimgerdemannia flammicorona]
MMVERTFHAARGGTVNFMAANYFRTKHLVSYTLMKQPVVEPSRGRVAIDNEAESYLIVLHTPGIDKKDLSIAVRDGNDEVTIEGNCHHDNEVGNVLVQTLAAGTFAVRVELPTKVHVNPVSKLDIQNGVTKIALTKSIPKRRRLLKQDNSFVAGCSAKRVLASYAIWRSFNMCSFDGLDTMTFFIGPTCRQPAGIFRFP